MRANFTITCNIIVTCTNELDIKTPETRRNIRGVHECPLTNEYECPTLFTEGHAILLQLECLRKGNRKTVSGSHSWYTQLPYVSHWGVSWPTELFFHVFKKHHC